MGYCHFLITYNFLFKDKQRTFYPIKYPKSINREKLGCTDVSKSTELCFYFSLYKEHHKNIKLGH